jgi:hypothetical protein
MARGGQLEKIVPALDQREASDPAGARPETERTSVVHSLGHGRSLALVPEQRGDSAAEVTEVIEIRAESGTLELRIRITDAGPVLEMQGIRLALAATESIEMKAPRVLVEAEESLTLASRGQAQLLAHDRLQVRTTEYLGLDGKLVGLRSEERTIVREMAEREFGGDVERCLQWLAEQAPAVDW